LCNAVGAVVVSGLSYQLTLTDVANPAKA